MKFRGLDSSGDWMMGQGLGSYAKDQAALALDIAARIRSRKGNCFFAPNDGVDYTNLMEKNRQKDLQADMTNWLMQTDGVVKINTVTVVFDPLTRGGRMTFDIQTVFTKSYKATLDNITGA